jgi:DNA-binding response OmpR family regulator
MSKILIVEDEEITALALELFCEKLGYTVIATVNNYEDVMNVIHKQRPDLIITDIELGEKESGLDIALKAQEQYGVPSIFLTAYYNDDILKKAKNIDFHGYIVKPYKEVELEATIKLALYQIEKDKPLNERYIEIANYIFDKVASKLYNEKEEISLSKKSKRLFYFLSNHLGETKSYTEIIDYVYEGEEVNLDTLRHLIKRTRTLTSKECIRSYRNIGYALSIN